MAWRLLSAIFTIKAWIVPSSSLWPDNCTGTLDKHLDPGSIDRNIVMKYAKLTGIGAEARCLQQLSQPNAGGREHLGSSQPG